VLLALGQGALGSLDGRLSWVKADLTQPEWLAALGEQQVDAVLSTTALHWLPAEVLVRVYHQLGQLVRPGGVFLNGDHLAFPPAMSRFREFVTRRKEQQRNRAFGQASVEDWESWWAALRREPGLEALFAEREARLAWRDRARAAPSLEFHEAALHDAGFGEVGVIWQHLDNRVLMALR
jgi:SAM-dependent methyltransferase